MIEQDKGKPYFCETEEEAMRLARLHSGTRFYWRNKVGWEFYTVHYPGPLPEDEVDRYRPNPA